MYKWIIDLTKYEVKNLFFFAYEKSSMKFLRGLIFKAIWGGA